MAKADTSKAKFVLVPIFCEDFPAADPAGSPVYTGIVLYLDLYSVLVCNQGKNVTCKLVTHKNTEHKIFFTY